MLMEAVAKLFRRDPAPIAPRSSQELSEAPALSPAQLDRIDGLEREVARLGAQLADIQLAWAETLDKLTAWANRQATRDRRTLGRKLEDTGESFEGPQHVQEAPASAAPPTKAELRARLAAMQRRQA